MRPIDSPHHARLARTDAAVGRSIRWSAVLGAVFVAYTLTYLAQDALPGTPDGLRGWWGWYDQSGYLASARAFADGTWRSVEHLYPPLYPWLGSLFVPAWPAHPFFVVDFVGLATYVAALLVVGRHHFGGLTTWIAVVACFVLFPTLTVKQWDIPWTTSLSSGIGAALLLVFFRLSRRGWVVAAASDWASLGGFSFGLGAMGAVRPLDAVVWMPAAAVFYAAVAHRNIGFRRPDVTRMRVFALTLTVIGFGLLVPIVYVAFNEATSGTLWGTYIIRNRANGYELHGFIRKFISLYLDSSAIYVERRQDVASHFWPIYLAIPLVFYFILRGSTILRVVSITIATQYLIYVPYSDLLPNGVLRYYNIHYFTWTFPWLLMLPLGFLRSLAGGTKAVQRPGRFAVLVVVACTLATVAIGLRVRPVGIATAEAAPSHAIAITFDEPEKIDFIDLVGVTGSWPDVYYGANRLEIDGKPLAMVRQFRLIPTDQGLRITLPRSVVGRSVLLGLDPAITIVPSLLRARAANVGLSFACRFSDCDLAPLSIPLPVLSSPTTVALDDPAASAPFLADGWYGAEPWGRWTSSPNGEIAFRIDSPRVLKISAEIQPLLSAERPQQTVVLTADGCRIGQVTFTLPGDPGPKEITGILPESCVPADGRVGIDLATEQAPSPHDIGLGEDRRPIGAGLKRFTVE